MTTDHPAARQLCFHGIILLSALFFASLSHAQTTTVSNDQMTVECGYQAIGQDTTSAPPYLVEISLKQPSELNSTVALQAPAISVPLHAKVVFVIDGHVSDRGESYGFFKFSGRNYYQDWLLAPEDSTVEDFCNGEMAPNITGVIDGGSYYEQISFPFLDPAKTPLVGSWFDDLKDDQLKEVPLISSWDAKQEGALNLQLEGNIGRDKKESLMDYSGWKWNPKRTKNGEAVSVSLELPITIVNDQDQSENAPGASKDL